tara:strand:- start:94759 stop:94899 length:141 start_codon:yes stop_codon:yes gene_type:complete
MDPCCPRFVRDTALTMMQNIALHAINMIAAPKSCLLWRDLDLIFDY